MAAKQMTNAEEADALAFVTAEARQFLHDLLEAFPPADDMTLAHPHADRYVLLRDAAETMRMREQSLHALSGKIPFESDGNGTLDYSLFCAYNHMLTRAAQLQRCLRDIDYIMHTQLPDHEPDEACRQVHDLVERVLHREFV